MNNQQLLDYLKLNCLGRECAVIGADLQKLFGCNDIREIQNAVRALRAEGFPISSSSKGKYKGYFYPTELSQTRECRLQMLNQAIHTFETIRNFDAAVENEFGIEQLHIEEFKISA